MCLFTGMDTKIKIQKNIDRPIQIGSHAKQINIHTYSNVAACTPSEAEEDMTEVKQADEQPLMQNLKVSKENDVKYLYILI